MNKFLEITKSWVEAINPSPEAQERAEKRITVCNDCNSKKTNDIVDFYYCGECGCPLRGKIYSPVEKSCPLNKWPV